MADASINVQIDQFTNLASGMSATMLVLLRSLGLEKGDTLTINEVDSSNVATGNVGFGLVEKIASGQFYNLPDIYNQYYLNPFILPTWIDYSTTSTVVGWSGAPTKNIWYKVVGDTVYCRFKIFGTSNSSAATFTLPNAASASMPSLYIPCRVQNLGLFANGNGVVLIAPSSSTFQVYVLNSLTVFSASNSKSIEGEFFYQI